jgi:hypothetical protein
MRVTVARDEPWRQLASIGRQVRVPLTSSAPSSHRPSQASCWCPRSKGSRSRATHTHCGISSVIERASDDDGAGPQPGRNRGGAGARGRVVLSANSFGLVTLLVSTLCVIATKQSLLDIIYQRDIVQQNSRVGLKPLIYIHGGEL